MANVHRIGDYNDNNPNGNNNPPAQGSSFGMWRSPNAGQSLFGEPRESDVDPRKETFFQMLRFNMCPELKFLSFCTITAIFLTIMYIIQLAVDGIKLSGAFLEVGHSGFFIIWGSRILSKITIDYQIWRLVTPLFLHLTFMHWLFNSISILIWGSLLEAYIKPVRMLILFMATGIAGNCFALCFAGDNTSSIGASTSIFGFFGGMAAFILLNWWKLPQGQRAYFICIVAFIIIMNFLMGIGNSMSNTSNKKNQSKDVLAHVGGLLAGICFGMFVCEWKAQPQPAEHKRWESIVKIVGYATSGLFCVFTVLGFSVFRTVKPYDM